MDDPVKKEAVPAPQDDGFGLWKYITNRKTGTPPWLVRLLARRTVEQIPPKKDRGRTPTRARRTIVPLSNQEISIASGLKLDRVVDISMSSDWSSITVVEAEQFCRACGFDPLSYQDRNRKRAYFKKCPKLKIPWNYLKRSPLWVREFIPLIRLMKTSPTGSSQQSATSTSATPATPRYSEKTNG